MYDTDERQNRGKNILGLQLALNFSALDNKRTFIYANSGNTSQIIIRGTTKQAYNHYVMYTVYVCSMVEKCNSLNYLQPYASKVITLLLEIQLISTTGWIISSEIKFQ